MKKLFLLSGLVALITLNAASFCGFYVAKADAKLFNKTSQVILVRDGNKTTVTMSNDFQGDVKDFAMVVPVPTVLKREDIRVSEAALFKKLDEYSGPRLVEYYDENPCEPRIYYDLVEMTAPMSEVQSISMKSIRRANNLGVKLKLNMKLKSTIS